MGQKRQSRIVADGSASSLTVDLMEPPGGFALGPLSDSCAVARALFDHLVRERSRSGRTSRRIAFAIPRLITNKDRGAERAPPIAAGSPLGRISEPAQIIQITDDAPVGM